MHGGGEGNEGERKIQAEYARKKGRENKKV